MKPSLPYIRPMFFRPKFQGLYPHETWPKIYGTNVAPVGWILKYPEIPIGIINRYYHWQVPANSWNITIGYHWNILTASHPHWPALTPARWPRAVALRARAAWDCCAWASSGCWSSPYWTFKGVVPRNAWFIREKIPSRNGWELGVHLF